MFLKAFPKGPCRLLYILLTTLQPVTPIHYSTFLCDDVLVLWDHQEPSDGITSLEADLDSNFTTKVFKAFTQYLCAWYHHVYVTVVFVIVTGVVGLCNVFVIAFDFKSIGCMIKILISL